MLWKKADKHLALLDYRTTPLEIINLSLAQLLMGRRPRNLLPASRELLMPTAFNHQEVKRRLGNQKVTQKYYHDKSATDLQPLRSGEPVRMATYPGSKEWSPGVVVNHHQSPRSYVVQSGGRNYRRNRQDLRHSTHGANTSEPQAIWNNDYEEAPESLPADNSGEAVTPRVQDRSLLPDHAESQNQGTFLIYKLC